MRICNSNLNEIDKKGVHVPSYDRKSLKLGLVHIGFGNFHRAHFLTYLDEMLCRRETEYGIFEVDVMPIRSDYLENFVAQDYMYSVLSLASDGTKKLRVNGPVMGYANETVEPERVLEVLRSYSTKLITLTITEKGYSYLDDKKSLDFDNPLVAHDLSTDEAPKSAVGLLAKVLSIREKDNNPVTIMSCDNVPENGNILKECIIAFCEKKYPDIVEWVKTSVAFPCTMVDRITPSTTPSDIEWLKEEYGIDDSCAVHCEDFLQWVVEDKKTTDIPDFSKVGAMVVEDVKPYELMKIRLLNGSHSALSYPSYMMGIQMVHKGIGDPLIHEFIRNRYMEDITGTLSPVPGIDLFVYKDKLVSRFSNPHIADTVLRLASDGSKKIANAILRPLEEGLEKGLPIESLIFVLSLWEYYFIFRDKDGNEMPIDDPKGDELKVAAENPEAFLKIAGLSLKGMKHREVFSRIGEYLAVFKEKGVADTLKGWLLN